MDVEFSLQKSNIHIQQQASDSCPECHSDAACKCGRGVFYCLWLLLSTWDMCYRHVGHM